MIEELLEFSRLVSAHSHLFSSNQSTIELTQLALIQPTSERIFQMALQQVKSKENSEKVFYKWT